MQVFQRDSLRQFCHIVSAVLAMTGGVTMRNISRWTTQGGSYRTVQRFFNTVLPWQTLYSVFFQTHLFDPDDVYLLAGDETVVPKIGDKTYGLSLFFSSTIVKAIPGLELVSQCRSSVSSSGVHIRCAWSRLSGAKSWKPRRKRFRLFQKLRKQQGNPDARKAARIETRPRSSSMTP